jgi:hypothetical protein
MVEYLSLQVEDVMITIFATPKPFRGHAAVIQRNAIHSWTLLRPACEIILMGNDEGTAEIAAEFGLRYVPEVARTSFGTPLVSDLFKQAQQLSVSNLFCYVNSDIILMSDFMRAIQRVVDQKSRFLLVGHRWNLDVNEVLEFKPDWEEKLRSQVKNFATLAGATSIDFFVFTRGLLGEMPPFAIGRPAWDNWTLYRARALSAPLIDATPVVMAVHQNHDYSHLPPGQVKEGDVWKSDEQLANIKLAGSAAQAFSLFDATHLLTPQKLRLAYDLENLVRHCETLPMWYPWLPLRWIPKALDMSRSLRSRFGLTLTSLRKGRVSSRCG